MCRRGMHIQKYAGKLPNDGRGFGRGAIKRRILKMFDNRVDAIKSRLSNVKVDIPSNEDNDVSVSS